LLRIDCADVRAFTRGGHDWFDKYSRVISAGRKLKCRSAVIDGEIRTYIPHIAPSAQPEEILRRFGKAQNIDL
jgi:ATP-dependent DNA ligase